MAIMTGGEEKAASWTTIQRIFEINNNNNFIM